MTTPLETYRRLVMESVVPYDPVIRTPSNTPPSASTLSSPSLATQVRHIHMDYCSSILRELCDTLEIRLASLESESLDLDELAHASGYIPCVLRESKRHVLSDRASVHDAFRETVFKSVQVLAGLLKITIAYEVVPDIGTSGALIVNGQPAVLFEHIVPDSAPMEFVEAISLGRQKSELDLQSSTATGISAVISKLCLAILSARLKYGVIHSGDCFVILRVADELNGGVPRCVISDAIKLTSKTTPIIQVILSLALSVEIDGMSLPRLGSESEAPVAEAKSVDNDVVARLVAKLPPVAQMENELITWRRLRDLAGIKIPGLFGAYVLMNEFGRKESAVLLQQDAGRALESFESLNHEQR
ncbi:hypothetical protein FRC01_011567 [Tulasnella sp. 417]|nr:hypothetical protein FRC01_011567 [Tulasnella sp. 417]